MRRCSVFLRHGWAAGAMRDAWKATNARKVKGTEEEDRARKEEAEARARQDKEYDESGFDEEGDDGPGGTPEEYMKLPQAYEIFDYKPGDRIETKDLKKRFRKLTLKHHPDQGGDHDTFQKVIQAHKILESTRHDKATVTRSGNKKPRKDSTFTYTSFDDMTNTPHRETGTELHKFDNLDIFLWVSIPTMLIVYYLWHNYQRGVRLIQSRARLREEEMMGQDDAPAENRHNWHAWRSTNDEKDALEYIEEVWKPNLSNAQREGHEVPNPFLRADPNRPMPTGFLACAQRL